MFNWFKKKEINQPSEKIRKYGLLIVYKNGKYDSYEVPYTNTMPIPYRKLINWYSNRESKVYTLRYQYGSVTFDRDNIQYIKTYIK